MSIEIPPEEQFRQSVDDLHGRLMRRLDAMNLIDDATGLRRPNEVEAFMQVFFDLHGDVIALGKAVRDYTDHLQYADKSGDARGTRLNRGRVSVSADSVSASG